MSSFIKVGINGFGRIGRTVFRSLLHHPQIQVVAINDLAEINTMAHLLKYDSIHGVLDASVSVSEQALVVNNRQFKYTSEKELDQLEWKGVDVVIEATGKFKTKSALQKHLQAGAQRVILSVPPEDDDIKMIVLGVNEQLLDSSDTIISNASCTTNNVAPMVKIVDDLCGIQQAYITTIHSYTTDQSLHDQPHRDLRRARAAGQSIVPTTTGAAKALTRIFPKLASVIGGCGIRVPVANGSLTDITFNVQKPPTIERINEAFRIASEGPMKGILQYTEDPIVSVDIVGNTHSCIFDAGMTSVIGTMVKIIGWYDNEKGYSSRIVDLILQFSRK
ncbi:MAG TPA: type I glyceraldehyde-3-phosphate dehydrogenase [Flavobacteriaceae bacterium]|nr:type I glyceraldehyde-3-phosphate dehydrogenase [Flavobacteriaceae bacterium]MCB9213592.1 type I glyceraldehyde-3-phosphate dehydrogenase [Alteromonas sp.]HPF12093.1 type I glyceraldehyde-3-phosphate dehydrogenase [Flavobacteriaceae bacterium]HQU21476.1 type I glyceraldehyde-3-phosphate dehydrogenase [Flavobacteriaceae bacterium]HQU65626.1 type I glyceraldehyde-3-phosphate dehydrogenase [Flavobacteriaceae bacterium]